MDHDLSILVLNGPLLLVGAGNMGGALLAGWLERGLAPAQLLVQDPGPPLAIRTLLEQHGVAWQPAFTPQRPAGLVLLAVKPQIMDVVAPSVAPHVGPDTVVLSVAAGRTIASLAKHFPPSAAIVRTIPNTPASVGRGMTVAFAGTNVSAPQRQQCRRLLEAVGRVAWVNDETLIDAATAVSGSGPAYVFLLAECLAEAGRVAGLPAELAKDIARMTVAGAGEMLYRDATDAGVLRQNVTSPNGTTAAALAVLMAHSGLQPLLTQAVEAARKRAQELSQ
jgi:pyrroline-5-carboxylate reductase